MFSNDGGRVIFNNTMYAEIDGVSIGSSLGLVLANISVDYYESLLFEKYCQLHEYLRYEVDTFSAFDSINDAEGLLPVIIGCLRSQIYTPARILFFSESGKINLIFTLVHHVLMICSSRLDQELEKILRNFCDHGYTIQCVVEHKIKCFKEPVVISRSLCPVYLKLP